MQESDGNSDIHLNARTRSLEQPGRDFEPILMVMSGARVRF